ncbi:NADPH-dependent FMN reductase [Actinacidiphila rubida]|uniref:NAD(P)H-dependent FMN reductase n=1 Tax=Actinacidiphila rubida TaxID=310780 RepID=A0A1H8Q7P5_9ACTN|nr:NADPH-dependent FMN reductase [Actinacidiphila rubida]SEO50076.1 NAD(P)H-dependent FMN reductase [Actinacidiphila rubida]
MTTLLLISGSTRAGSTNSAALHTVADLLGEEADCVAYQGLAQLPHFNPDDDHDPLPAEVARLRTLIAEAGAVLFCTPEYAGDLPGSFKNLLDWTVGGSETSGKPSGWINVSSAPTGAAGAHRALRTVLTYTDARVVDEACVDIPVPRSAIDPATGRVSDPAVRDAMAAAARRLLAAV